MFSDGIPVLLLTPFLLFVAQGRRFFERRQLREALLLGLAVTVTVTALFFTPRFLVPFQSVLAYIAFPGVIWAGLRFGLPGVTAVLLLLGIESLCGVKWGALPFHSGELKHDLMAFQFFLTTTALTGLLLGAVCEERRSFLARLRKSEGELHALLDHSPMAILLKGLDGRIILANRAYEEDFQCSQGDLRGRTLEELTRGERALPGLECGSWIDESIRSDADVLQTLRMATYETSVPEPKGARHYVVTKFPVLDATGQPKSIASISLDITDHRRLEEQLRQSQKMEAIGQLAGGVAHDFNNILTAISLSLGELIERPELSKPVLISLQELQEQVDLAANLTRQLLAFSRQSVMTIRPLRVAAMVESALKLLRPLLGERIRVEFRSAPGIPWIVADAGMLEQVVVNLAVNARDAMPEGGHLTVELDALSISDDEVGAHPGGRAGRFVRLTVRDTGHGIAPALLPLIFQPFFTTKEVGKGSGLGLATVYGIVEQHHGWVEAVSEPGQGSLFSVFLPAQDVVAPLCEKESPPLVPTVSGGTETILVVEDDPLVRGKVASSLRAAGYHVLTAVDGLDALSLWTEHGDGIDLLLTDMIMPRGFTGLELAGRLRKGKPNLKVIISSGYNVEVDNHGLSDEDIDYLPKPYQPRTLCATVRQCLDRKKTPAVIRPGEGPEAGKSALKQPGRSA